MDVSARKKLVSEYLCKLAGKQDLDDSVNIFETGLVNSLAAIQLISFLEKNFKIKVEIDDLDNANFSSIQAVCHFLDRKVAVNA
ncbi:acyl carrier protein [Xenorhabdus bovienii]|uniref:Putative D-alanyl carrier protein n=3 Tax=Xenorhabdus bovienii TaxID=40576 RepID=A0A0B6X7P2_XENBV|nr:acyl carrier protein [Xenorhabdus bovienii]MCG3461635.1 phosphopantetheine-binding protein [Xenorhabdus bovienii]MCG3470917.1 phosphopantetheine-binding protein [Xenorhabdus bovienii]CDG89019.1 putative D-alanyl carrier protein [Xenorhabdus bovienii str. feltiae France]CDG91839.1 putative D-alanyl carrier protein [Xenorhabdus bovienii str. feltiae Florida]CDG99408.1 putative D-alanyl carrier protein [Xenorhabdus bovienii str. puntauvense]